MFLYAFLHPSFYFRLIFVINSRNNSTPKYKQFLTLTVRFFSWELQVKTGLVSIARFCIWINKCTLCCYIIWYALPLSAYWNCLWEREEKCLVIHLTKTKEGVFYFTLIFLGTRYRSAENDRQWRQGLPQDSHKNKSEEKIYQITSGSRHLSRPTRSGSSDGQVLGLWRRCLWRNQRNQSVSNGCVN